MKIEIRKIALSELSEFIKSEEYNTFKNVPISDKRAESYLHNPNAKPTDFVMYLALANQELIGYRTIYKDIIQPKTNPTEMGWLSGNWVHKAYRRQGISSLIFAEIYKDWNGRLMFTNFSPESEKMYLNTQHFTVLKNLKGKRYYVKSCLSDILVVKYSIFATLKPVLKLIDGTINAFLSFFERKKTVSESITIENLSDKTPAEFQDKFNTLFQKNKNDWEWFSKFPFIETHKPISENNKRYHFSSWEKNYQRKCITITRNSKTIAMIVIIIKGNSLKTPYYFFEEDCANEIVNLFQYIFKKYNIHYATIFSNEINKALKNKYLTKNFNQKFYITKELNKVLNLQSLPHLYAGDGDGILT